MYMIRDRWGRPGITTCVEKDIPKDDWPFAIDAPSPPFGFGKVVALVTDMELAEKIVHLLNGDGKEN